MPVWHGEKGKKKTGGEINLHRKKKKYELGSNPTLTKLGAEKRKKVRTKGGGKKVRAMSIDRVNLYDPSSKKTEKVKIVDVVKNPANPHFVRRNVITKGTVIETESGLAKVTSRPSQDGVVNAVLVKE